MQVQTLYYLGPAGSARKRTAAAASQGDRSAPLELTAADLEAAVTAAAQEAAGAAGKKGGKRGKRRKKGGATAEPPEKENEQPVGVDGMKGSKAGSPPPAEVAQVCERASACRTALVRKTALVHHSRLVPVQSALPAFWIRLVTASYVVSTGLHRGLRPLWQGGVQGRIA